MNTQNISPTDRPVERWFSAYSKDHQHPLNQRLHVFCVPAIVWSLMAILYAVPTPDALAAALPPFGMLAAVLAALSLMFWLWMSLPLGLGIAVLTVAGLWVNALILDAMGSMALLAIGVAVFIIAWIGQFIGHRIEGRRPSFFTDLVYLMIGPPWVLAKAYRSLGLRW
ncbi:MAG: DUF962 domain-containing protein [Gammaproteobacteria bacterium]|nr:DUF962 domain-containing protein [Gammaproteobacteria bacterium]